MCFMESHSCPNNLTAFLLDMTTLVDNSNGVDVINTDIYGTLDFVLDNIQIKKN